ncbi:MAG TPA: DUF4097 family beta strand repeat-containing protein [Gemmatimonadaceae bacterium]|nr:DUF4097 family beta strand repeat-containing protein [Gemmatimonadaceae bacterium]
MRIVLPFAALVAVVLTSGPAPGHAQQPERFTLAGPSIAIFNLAGEVRVEAGSGADVVVEATRGGLDAAELRFERGPIGGRETFRVIYPDDDVVYDRGAGWSSRTDVTVRDDGTFFGGERGSGGRRIRVKSSGSGTEAYANLVVRVPAGKQIALYLAVGEATVTGVTGDVLVDVGAADVTTSKTKGKLTLDTGSGEVEITDAEGDVFLDSGSGGATFTRVRGSTLLVDAGSGGIRGNDITVEKLELDLGSGGTRLSEVKAKEVRVDAGSGTTEIELASDVEYMDVDTGSGGVTLRVPEQLGAELDVETGSGGISVDVPVQVTRRSRSRLIGTIGDGKGQIRIDAGSGGVRIRR